MHPMIPVMQDSCNNIVGQQTSKLPSTYEESESFL